jgi:hypothetical protein
MADKKDLGIKKDPTPKQDLVVNEVTSLNLNDLDVEELERRVELALGGVHALCFIDLCYINCCGCNGTNCTADCGTNCVANCSTACGGNCSALCTIDCCTEAKDAC